MTEDPPVAPLKFLLTPAICDDAEAGACKPKVATAKTTPLISANFKLRMCVLLCFDLAGSLPDDVRQGMDVLFKALGLHTHDLARCRDCKSEVIISTRSAGVRATVIIIPYSSLGIYVIVLAEAFADLRSLDQTKDTEHGHTDGNSSGSFFAPTATAAAHKNDG